MTEVTSDALDSEDVDLGPIDYLVVEYAGGGMSGEGIPHLIALVEAGIISIIDLVVVRKNDDGTFDSITPADVADIAPELAVLDNVAIDVLDDEDVRQVAEMLPGGSTAVLIVYENTWAAPLVGAMRRSGGAVIASGRIGAEDLVAALEAMDEGV